MGRANDLLVGLNEAFRQIGDITSLGKQRYDSDEFVRLALQRVWITTGTLAEQYRVASGLPEGAEPWAELYVYRCILAHALRAS